MSAAERLFPAELGDVLSTAVVAQKLGLTREGVLGAARKGYIPRPLKVGPKSYRFVRAELIQHLTREAEGGANGE